MPLNFTKMHGLGNDYVYVGLFDQTVENPARLAEIISDRHRGVGSDGLILVGPPELIVGKTAGTTTRNPLSPKGEDAAHVRMQMYNSDGSRSQMCGNGIRCVAKLAYERGWARHNPLRIATDAGVLTLELTLDEQGRVSEVRVDMGEPILTPERIPVLLGGETVVKASLPLPNAKQVLSMTCVSMGNPHAVFFLPDIERVPLRQWGPEIERHPLFPERVNAHFVQVLAPNRVKMVTWERGAGPTQACGTGATAVCVAGALNGLTHRAITAQLPGGELKLEWDETTNHVFKTGPATEVFTGVWRPDD